MGLNYQTALAHEHTLLLDTERTLSDGEESVPEHLFNMEAQRAGGSREAERLIQLLEGTLVRWTRHRDMVRDRVTYLEGLCGSPAAMPTWMH